MAGSLNKVTLIGHLGADPEVRRLPSGAPVVNFRMATSESWKDKDTGERKERTEWHSIVCFNENICTVIEQYTHKGSKVYVEGVLRTRKWQDQSGADRYTTEVHIERFVGQLILLDSARSGSDRDSQYDQMQSDRYGGRGGSANDSGRASPMQREPQRQGNVQSGSQRSRFSDMDDDIPF